MTETVKCAHPACKCTAQVGKKHCSDSCANAKSTPEIACQCHHDACKGMK